MRQDERGSEEALERARLSAYPPGEFVGQEGFMPASQIRSLAVRAGIGPGVSVLDLCCGVAGPGTFITEQLGCTYLGVDENARTVGLARERATGLPCRFGVARIPPVPPGRYDVVLMLETMLAFADKDTLLRGVASALRVGGRFAFTVEEGQPLTQQERQRMPDANTVCLVPLSQLVSGLESAGLQVGWVEECSRSHSLVVDSLIDAYTAGHAEIAAHIGHRALDDLLVTHRRWSDWLATGRVRKFAFAVEKVRRTRRHPLRGVAR